MNKYIPIFLLAFLMSSLPVFGQSRKYITQFSFFPSYFNPSLVGYGGSSVNGIIRNQWGGFDGAPKTMFLNGEIDFDELPGSGFPDNLGRNSIGLNIMHDQQGPFNETGVLLNYGNRLPISNKHHVRMGMGLNFTSLNMDGSSLTPEQSDDPTLNKYLGGFAEMTIFDFNIGMALTHKKYYFAYSMQNVSKGKISSGDPMISERPSISNFQAGYRRSISEKWGLIGNALYRTQVGVPNDFEFNLKALLMDQFWVGAGHRWNNSTHLLAGVSKDRFRVGYVFEIATTSGARMRGSTHEFMASVQLFEDYEKGIFGIW
ncbi:type IX secretion system membrane protein PorP/SprF [Echinicola jeungdonensis]|uniref:Type IX secretion system membrane protein PorP/SprF n=1 Tax=Echinicola jeungdonensis TaxID=709343 RepID=A0ABV5J443_9BACT|nr:type IX secretion system membrane protein PorP/SprF [Echinicola jeungdonensis]MDN3670085.1 type IX secretion system membrane protein PorP/SprF [Echinicola jeungdonensis]